MKSTTNVFLAGLQPDRHPLTAENTLLTDALNATYITKNGNEGMLQNDMGNALILDTATGQMMQLREGFVPVGMKEHGGILYIVSADKEGNGEIGTIPSPIITWDYIDITNNSMESLILADGKSISSELRISNKIHPGEQYAVILNLEVSDSNLWNGSYFTCPDLGYYDPYKTLANKKTFWQKDDSPLISTVDKKGFYDINLYSSSDYNSYIISTDLKQSYYITSDSKLYTSDFWFIPIQLLGQQSLNLKYMTIDGLFSKYPGTISAGKLTIKASMQNIQKFELVKRAGSLLNTKLGESYVPYTMTIKENGALTYYTYFSSFRYTSDSSVRINKLKISIIRQDTQENVPIYRYVAGGSQEITDNILNCAPERIIQIVNKDNNKYNSTNNLISNNLDSSYDFYTFKYDNWYYLLRKVYSTEPENNGFKSFDDSKNKEVDRHGLFYIKSTDYNVWYTMNVEYYDLVDRLLGTYEVKFNPFYNDYTGDGWDETQVTAKRSLDNFSLYSFLQRLSEGDRIITAEFYKATDWGINTKTSGYTFTPVTPSYSIPKNYLNISKIETSSEVTTKSEMKINCFVPVAIKGDAYEQYLYEILYNILINNNSIFKNTDLPKKYFRGVWEEYYGKLYQKGSTDTLIASMLGARFIYDTLSDFPTRNKALPTNIDLGHAYYINSDSDYSITKESTVELKYNVKNSIQVQVQKPEGSADSDIREISIGTNLDPSKQYVTKPLRGTQEHLVGTPRRIKTTVLLPEQVTLNFDKPVYNTKIISQIDHYYNYRDLQGNLISTLGNVAGDGSVYETTLHLNSEGIPKNYVILTNCTTDSEDTYSKISSKNIPNIFKTSQGNLYVSQLNKSINLSLWTDSRLINRNKVVNYNMFKETISFSPLSPGTYVIQGLFTDSRGIDTVQRIVIKLGDIILSIQPNSIYIIKIDKQIIPEIVPFDNAKNDNASHCNYFVDFGIYKNKDIESLPVNTPYSLVTAINKKLITKTDVILQLSETYQEPSIECLGNTIMGSYPPANAYLTSLDLDRQSCNYTIKVDGDTFGTEAYFNNGKLHTHLDTNNPPQIRFINE